MKQEIFFFPKLDFDKGQIYFKEIALDFLKENGFEPEMVKSEKEAKDFDFDGSPSKYPIYFFNTDTSGEITYEEFYTEEEDYNIDNYDSLGFINTPEIKISFEDVEADFENVFNNPILKNQIYQLLLKNMFQILCTLKLVNI